MSRYRIIERVGDHYERVESYADLERHHPSAERQPGRDYATIDGKLEEVRHLEDGRILVKKDFILLRDPAGPVYVPAPVSGYIHHLNDPTNAVRIYDRPDGRNSARLLAQSLHMEHGSSPPTGTWIDYGMPLGRMGDAGSPGSVHVHLEAEPAQYRRYIQDISAGNITPERYPDPGLARAASQPMEAMDMRAIQRALNQLGHRDPHGRSLAVDGIAGVRTVHALQSFQREQRLVPDGVAGPLTQGALSLALVEHPLRVPAPVPGLLRQGAAGAEVTALQSVLGRLGYEPEGRLRVDGHFGPATARAVEEFQKAHGLEPDRIVGDQTRAALRTSMDQPLISERTHPRHALFLQATGALERLQASGEAPLPGGNSNHLAASLALASQRGGLDRIDSVAVGRAGDRLYALQGEALDPRQRHVSLDLHSATLARPVASPETLAVQAEHAQAQVIQPPGRQRALVP